LAQEVPTLLGSFPQRASVKGGTMLEINGGHRDDKMVCWNINHLLMMMMIIIINIIIITVPS